jgi:thiamine kinase-like enzyme
LNFTNIISKFCIEADLSTIKPYGSGHINDTFYIQHRSKHLPGYLLQRVNHNVFKDVPSLMSNIHLVTRHLKSKFSEVLEADNTDVLALIITEDGRYYYHDDAGNYWRMYEYIENTKSIDQVESSQQAYQGGKAFGVFQTLLFDMDINLLHYTIPDFHHIGKRLSQLNDAIQTNPQNRKKCVVSEIEFILERTDSMFTLQKLAEQGEIPLRITHNDTKFNNLLFNNDNKVKCVIDLDTVMPGYVAFDFGDAIRTIINTASEDEKDLDQINLNISLFKAFTEGYLTATAKFLTQNEIKSLSLAVLLFPYMQAVRFLTDYLNGDVYYKVQFSEHNLQRTRAQLQLLKKLEERFTEIEEFISATASICLKSDINTNSSATA